MAEAQVLVYEERREELSDKKRRREEEEWARCKYVKGGEERDVTEEGMARIK